MNLNFIELLTILQLTTIRNSSGGNNNYQTTSNIKASYIKTNLVIYTRLSKVSQFCLRPSSTKNNALRPLGQTGCASEGARWSSGINAANGSRGPRFASRILPT